MRRKPQFFNSHPLSFPEVVEYRAYVAHIVDGDTIDVFIDLGCFEYVFRAIRLEGIDTYESFRPKTEQERVLGLAATEYLTKLILNTQVKIKTSHKSTFGRIVAHVYRYDSSLSMWVNVADDLRSAGFEKPTFSSLPESPSSSGQLSLFEEGD